MSIFKKIFSSNKEKQKPLTKNKQKTNFLNWLCSSKTYQQHDQYQNNSLNSIPLQSSAKKSTISVAQTNNTKIIQRLSFVNNSHKQFIQEDVTSTLISIQQKVINRIQDLIEQDGLYGMVNGDEPLSKKQANNAIWLKIGKGQQINSLCHIKPYYFTSIFIFSDEFGYEFSIEEILLSRQNIFLRVQKLSSTQEIIDSYEKQLNEHYGFKPLSQCFSKLKLIIFKTKNNHNIWIQFNKQTPIQSSVEDILSQIGFNSYNEEYSKLQDQIPNLLTLQEYMEFIDHKNKLMSKYEAQNVDEYIKNKFLQKINSKSHPRNTDSPRTLQKNISNQESHSQSSGYNEYILSMTANTLPKDKINQLAANNIVGGRIPEKNSYEKNSYEEEIFEFNIYKQDREQEAKRVAISKERKKRSRSQDITVGDLHNCDDLQDQNDYFDKRQ